MTKDVDMLDSIAIRPMTAADIPACAAWIAATPLWQRYRVTEPSIANRLRTALSEGATIYVAERADQVVGFLWLVERGAFDRSVYIRMIGVRPGERSHGIGRMLMEFVEAQVFPQGHDLFLLVSDFNVDAQRFYERLGYCQVGKLDNYVLEGVSELIYRKMREQE